MGCTVSLPVVACVAIPVIGLLYFCTVSVIFQRLSRATANQIVFVTGCDSGLGYSFALHAHKLGFTVIAGCLQPESEGSKQLVMLCSERLHVLGLDITSETSVRAAVKAVEDMLERDRRLELRALINNAGVMVFGEFEWLTEQHIQHQINVNLLGTMRITKSFCSVLRKYKGRIITVTSHCALASLPGIAVYGATKAGLAAWSDSLRLEQAKYGVRVISFIPGTFTKHSSIMARQVEYTREMEEAMTYLNHQFFDEYFKRYNRYLSALPTAAGPVSIPDDKLYSLLEDALLSNNPRCHYKCEPFRYKYYHFLMKISPTWLRDYFAQKFLKMPEFGRKL